MHKSLSVSSRRWLVPSALAFGMALGIFSLAGCGDDDDGTKPTTDGGGGDVINPDGGPEPDPGNIMNISVAGNSPDVESPFDSTPDPSGTNVYFTGISTADGTAGVFKVAATGGAVTKLFSGSPLDHPVGIAMTVDGTKLFIADPAASATDTGQIFSMPVAGGTPTSVAGTDGYEPKAISVVGETLYFSGTDKATGQPGVFKIGVNGGAIATVTSGGPLQDPSGVTANAAGDVFFVDSSSAGARLGTVYKVAAGQNTPTELSTDVGVGYPAGVALSGDGTALLVSSISQTTFKDEVRRIELSTGKFTVNAAGPIGQNVEAAGLHRAATAKVYSWCDSLAGGGTVYLLK